MSLFWPNSRFLKSVYLVSFCSSETLCAEASHRDEEEHVNLTKLSQFNVVQDSYYIESLKPFKILFYFIDFNLGSLLWKKFNISSMKESWFESNSPTEFL